VPFRVTWGDPFRGFTQELVVAYDVEQALVVAHEERPELPRPRTAYLVSLTSRANVSYTARHELII